MHPGGNWQSRPTRIDSPEIRAAYPERRFYTVRSSPPLPPGANIRDIVEKYQRAMDEWISHHYINATVSIDAERVVRELRGIDDYNDGLAPARKPDELARAAAAIFTLHGNGYDISPVEFSASSFWQACVSRARIPG